MKTKMIMHMPEMLEHEREVEITGIAVISENEYMFFRADGQLPERYLARLNKYTEAVTSPGFSTISEYKALLVVSNNGKDGVAVCGQNAVSYASSFPRGGEWLDSQVSRMCNYVCELSRVPGAKSPYKMDMKNLGQIFDLTVTADNGIGDLLADELKTRDEITDVILHEDCMEINYALDYGMNSLNNPGEVMTLMSLIGCNLRDVHLLHDSEEHDLATIIDLTPDTLTEQGKKDWADVLGAKVESISHGYYGTQIDLSGCTADRLRDFSHMLAGNCPVSDYDNWVNDGEKSPDMTMQ